MMVLVLEAAVIVVVLLMVDIQIVTPTTTVVNPIINVTEIPAEVVDPLVVALIAEKRVTFPENVRIRKKNVVEVEIEVVEDALVGTPVEVDALNVVKKVTFRENAQIMAVVVVVEIVVTLEGIVVVAVVTVEAVEEVVVALTVGKRVTFPGSVLMLEVEVETVVAVVTVEGIEKVVLLVENRVIFQESVQKLEETEGTRDAECSVDI